MRCRKVITLECEKMTCDMISLCAHHPQLAEKEDFEQQLKDFNKFCLPIVTKLHQGAGGMPEGGMPGGFPGAGGAGGAEAGGKGGIGPTVEEVD